MILDKEQHRVLLLEMLKQMQVPGQHLDAVFALKQAIVGAQVVQPRANDEAATA